MHVVMLLGVILAGCDIAPTENIDQDGALGEPNPGNLDAESDENVAAYFYAGKPVAGLVYSCSKANFVQYSGKTDENGRFVCPRDNKATFYVGVPRTGTIKLGQVDLVIFGSSGSVLKRKNVVITPATLFGTHVTASRREIINIFNLLYSLDSSDPAARRQQIIELTEGVMANAAQLPEFATLLEDGGVRANTPVFNTRLKALVDQLAPSFDLTLESRPAGEPLGESDAFDIATAAMLRARVGLYQTSVSMQGVLTSTRVLLAQTEFLVGNEGTVSGVIYSREYLTNSGSSLDVRPVLLIDDEASVSPDGILQGFVFGTGIDSITLLGTLINDAIYGESRVCKPSSPNELIPAVYCASQPIDGGFSIDDVGRWQSPIGYEDELMVLQQIAGFPDADLDNLPSDESFPMTFEMTLGRYPNIRPADFYSSLYDGVGEDKAVFGTPLLTLPRKLRYTLMPNGDIVSDADDDCATLQLVAGRYQDSDGSPEYLIGQVGSIFTAKIPNATPETTDDLTDTFVDIYFNALDPGYTDFFGFTAGISATYRPGLHQMVLQLSDDASRNGSLRSKSCDPTSTTVCTHAIEWMNNVEYYRNVYSDDVASPAITAADNTNYMTYPYYGQVQGNSRVAAGPSTVVPNVCPAAP